MKQIIKYILVICPLIAIFSCKMDLATYDQPQNRLNFLYPSDTVGGVTSDTIIRFTFVYEPLETEYDTIWVPVRTMGYVTDKDRRVSIRQGQSDEPKAVAGTHYVPFDDAELVSKHYWIRAGQNSALIPVVAIRDEQLKTKEYTLRLEIDPNEDFEQGYPSRSYRLIHISDILTKPSKWNAQIEHYFAGKYGPVKHQFMIDCVRDRGMVINDDWLDMVMPQNPPDMALTGYWCGFFTEKLIELNRERAAQGLDVLREAPTMSDPDGMIVRFSLLSTPQPYI